MQPDRFTRTCLGVIAISLALIALKPLVPVAHAAETLECSFDGPLEIKRIEGTVKIEMDHAYGTAGSSSSHPMYVEVKD